MSENKYGDYHYQQDASGVRGVMDSMDLLDRGQKVISRSFLYMFAALIVSGLGAYYAISSGLYITILMNKTVFYGMLAAELVVVFAATATIAKNKVALSAILFTVYSILTGINLSWIFFVYDLGSVSSVFISAAAVFGIMAVFGLATKKNLSTIGTIGMMGLVGIIVVTLLNMFLFKSSGLNFILNIVGLAVFIGLTAYDAQKIKNSAANMGLSVNSLALLGALNLYLDFINIFLRMLQLFGKKSN